MHDRGENEKAKGCICGADVEGYCSVRCATAARASREQAAAIDQLVTMLALEDELAELRAENGVLREVELAVSDYLAVAIPAGDAIARGDRRALHGVAEIRARMVSAISAARRARGVPGVPPTMQVG